MFKETQKIIRVGNSLGLYIKRMGSTVWTPTQGETVTVEYKKNKIVITKGEN